MSRFHEELYRRKGHKHDQLVIKCVSKSGIDAILSIAGRPDDIDTMDYETEVLCKKGNFIIGYADILIKISRNRIECQKEFDERFRVLTEEYRVPAAEARRSVRNYLQMKDHNYFVLVECKPALEDIGSAIRQLKTYEDAIKGEYDALKKVIATYDTPSEDVIEYLRHEGVSVFVVEGL